MTTVSHPRPDRLREIMPAAEWASHADDVAAIAALKRSRRAVVLAHNYQAPEIFHGVADFVGDSLALARLSATVDAEVIVLAGVHFMAETTKLLAPGKTVLIPEREVGCSLAESITPEDVALLREAHPGVPVVTYVNTSAAVKAASDVCCTSGNARRVVESLGVPKVIMLPDEHLARNVARTTSVEIVAWHGRCEVHDLFDADDVRDLREAHPGITVLAHPECPPAVAEAADFVGSTADMVDYVGTRRPARVVLLTECSMSDNVAVEYPEVDFVRPCNLCPHMRKITLKGIRRALEEGIHEVTVDPAVAVAARRAVERMLSA